MRIAVIGWGSLIWQAANDHGEVLLRRDWRADGPLLPIEFARISSDSRLTLIVVPGYSAVSRALWAESRFDAVDEALENLAQRETGSDPSLMHGIEGMSPIGSPHPEIAAAVSAWLGGRPELDAAIWAGFGPGERWGPEGWSLEQAYRHVASLRGAERERALEYLRKAPEQIDTPVRRALREVL